MEMVDQAVTAADPNKMDEMAMDNFIFSLFFWFFKYVYIGKEELKTYQYIYTIRKKAAQADGLFCPFVVVGFLFIDLRLAFLRRPKRTKNVRTISVSQVRT